MGNGLRCMLSDKFAKDVGPWKHHLTKKSHTMTELAAECAKTMDEQRQELATVTFDAGIAILAGSSDLKREAMREKMKMEREAAVAATSARKKRVVTVTVSNFAPVAAPLENAPAAIVEDEPE